MTESIDGIRASWNDRALGMNADLEFEARFLKPFAYTPAFYLARRMDFASLLQSAKTVSQIGAVTHLPSAAVQSLMDLLSTMGLVEREDTGYAASQLGQRVLDPRSATEFLDPVFRFFETIIPSVADLAAPASVGRPPESFDWPPSNQRASADFEALMTATSPYVAAWLDELLDWKQIEDVLDVGGGDGTITAMLCAKHANVNSTVFNLPWARTLIEATARDYDLGGRLVAFGGDFRQDPLPRGFDLVLFSRLLSDWDDTTVSALLAQAQLSLRPGGRVIAVESKIGEDMSGPTGTDEHPWAFFWDLFVPGFILHGPRTRSEWCRLSEAAGFEYRVLGSCRRLPFPELVAIELIQAS